MFAAKVLFFAGLASTYVVAFQQMSSDVACTPNQACSYTYTGTGVDGQDVPVEATGNCNAQGQCLGNGAVCANDDQCYNFCGTAGTCGGVGAACYSSSQPEVYGGAFVTCDQPSAVCSVDCADSDFGSCPEQGACLLAASQAASRFRKARRSETNVKTDNFHMMMRRAAQVVAQPGDETVL